MPSMNVRVIHLKWYYGVARPNATLNAVFAFEETQQIVVH